MALRDTREKDRVYMREYMRRRRGSKTRREREDRRPFVLPTPVYEDLTAAALGDPPIGRRAIDAAPGCQPYQLQAYQLEARL